MKAHVKGPDAEKTRRRGRQICRGTYGGPVFACHDRASQAPWRYRPSSCCRSTALVDDRILVEKKLFELLGATTRLSYYFAPEQQATAQDKPARRLPHHGGRRGPCTTLGIEVMLDVVYTPHTARRANHMGPTLSFPAASGHNASYYWLKPGQSAVSTMISPLRQCSVNLKHPARCCRW